MIPSWWQITILTLAVVRVWRLIAADEILTKPRDWLLDRAPQWVDEFVACPYCMGAWLSAAAWGAWQAWPHTTMVACGLIALSQLVGLVGANTVD